MRKYCGVDVLMNDNNYQNRGTVKVVRQQLHEITELNRKYTDIASKYRDLLNRFADMNILYTQSKGENKKLKVLLEVATKEIQTQRKEIVEDLNTFGNFELYPKENALEWLIKIREKWEGK